MAKSLEEYKKLFWDIASMSVDADTFGLNDDTISDEDVEKCKYIAAYYSILNDVPLGRIEHIFNVKGITEEEVEEFIDKLYEEK